MAVAAAVAAEMSKYSTNLQCLKICISPEQLSASAPQKDERTL